MQFNGSIITYPRDRNATIINFVSERTLVHKTTSYSNSGAAFTVYGQNVRHLLFSFAGLQ